MVKDVKLSEALQAVKSGKFVVDFWAPWCGPCKMFVPVFERVGDSTDGVEFLKVNVQDNPEAASELGINSIPCIIFFKDGEELSRFVGVQSENEFRKTISEVF